MPTITMPRNISGSVSKTANYVGREIEDSYMQLQLSSAYGLMASGVFQELIDVFKECSSSGWDGNEARPISQEVLRNSWDFLESLPYGTEPPEISAEPDGAITLEWFRSPRRVLSISINPEGWVYYAALIGKSRRHGVDFAPIGISEDLLNFISQIIQD